MLSDIFHSAFHIYLIIRVHDYTGGGQPSPPPVPPVRHAGALTRAEWAPSCHRPVRQGDGEKALTDGGGEDTGNCGYCLSGLWQTAQDGYLFQISWSVIDSGRRKLSGGSG